MTSFPALHRVRIVKLLDQHDVTDDFRIPLFALRLVGGTTILRFVFKTGLKWTVTLLNLILIRFAECISITFHALPSFHGKGRANSINFAIKIACFYRKYFSRPVMIPTAQLTR